MSAKQSRFLKKQKIALGISIALVMLILAYLSTLLIEETPFIDGFKEGQHYSLLENPRRIRGDKIEVMEFFSYGCIHCYNLEDDLLDWTEDKKESVKFIRTPVIANEQWRTFGRAYYAMQAEGLLEANHKRVFREIHEVRRNQNLAERFSEFLFSNSQSEEKESFIKSFNSLPITQKIERADQLARRFKIATVPNLVVNGKYLVRASSSVGLSRMLDVVDHLIELENSPER
ncbi:MAG: thiol:disulfide interchange protein DsbA/DsbL [Pseudomonadales bacterium]|nr:thiol:disulfide interchange protein DsbA/DsbL [Pseudomonadales bacterium]